MTGRRFEDLSLTEVRDLSESAAAVAAAVTAGIFTALADEPAAAPRLAARLGLDPRGVEILLPFLEELGLLERGHDGYRPAARAKRELVDPESSGYQAGGLPLWLTTLQAWTRLPESLETGEPIDSADREEESDEESRRRRIATFMAGMAAAPRDRIRRLVDGVLERTPNARMVLDLGGGPGHISQAFVERGLEATVLDRPEVIDFVREEYGLADLEGIQTVGADFLEDPLPRGPFDILLASNILHMLSPSEIRTLLRRARTVAAPNGVLAVADFVRGLSPRAARFALTMLLRTEGGNTYTLEEHRDWFREAGFDEPEVTELDPDRQLVTAVVVNG